jgi:hypothetical protein
MNATDRPGFPITPRVIVGLLIVGFGIALLLDELNVIEAGQLIRYWPVALAAVGAAKLLQDPDRSGRTVGALMLGFGVLSSLDLFLPIAIDAGRLWPLAIVAFGILLVTRAFRGAQPDRQGLGYPAYPPQVPGGPPSALSNTARPGLMEQTLSEFAMWSGIQRRVSSPAFRRGELTAIMGGIELDLRQAGTENGEAVLDVFVLWGGIEIIVPPDWAVSNQVTPIMGGAEDGSTGTQASRHRLVVKGVVIMGGVDIKV